VTGIEEDEGVVPDYSNATTDFSTEGGQNSNEQGVEGGNDEDKVGYDDTNSEEDFTSPPAMSSSGGNLNKDESEYNLYPTSAPEPEYSWYGNGGTDEVDYEYEVISRRVQETMSTWLEMTRMVTGSPMSLRA
jgi:hypothetical protein